MEYATREAVCKTIDVIRCVANITGRHKTAIDKDRLHVAHADAHLRIAMHADINIKIHYICTGITLANKRPILTIVKDLPVRREILHKVSLLSPRGRYRNGQDRDK